MYLNHPLDSDNFDFKEFAEQNEEILRKLFIESLGIVPGPISSDQVVDERACLVTMAILARTESLNEGSDDEPIEVEIDETDPLILNLFDHVRDACVLMHLEQMGIAEKRGEGWDAWKLTEFGDQQFERGRRKRRGSV